MEDLGVLGVVFVGLVEPVGELGVGVFDGLEALLVVLELLDVCRFLVLVLELLDVGVGLGDFFGCECVYGFGYVVVGVGSDGF